MNINTTIHRWITMKLIRWSKDCTIASIAMTLIVLTSGTAVAQVDAPDLLYPTLDPANTRTGRSITHNLELNPTILSLEYVRIRSKLLRDGAKQLRVAFPSGQTDVISLADKYALDKESTTWHGLIDVKEGKIKNNLRNPSIIRHTQR